MAEPFTLTAFPCVLSEGEHKGHLEFITFVAENSEGSQKWTAVNTGTLVQDFMEIVDRNTAEDIVRRLSHGEQVLFPGFWAIEEIKHQFGGAGND
jgi:hypothetical protein